MAMNQNLEKLFIVLERSERACMDARAVAVAAYPLLFQALAEDLGLTTAELAKRVGFDPLSGSGTNKIISGESMAGVGDALRLLAVYLGTRP